MLNKLIYLGIIFAVLGVSTAFADIHPEFKNKKGDKLQRNPTGLFDNQKNTVSNLEFFASNYGIFGYDIANRVGGGYWPRNSKNQYIYAGGAWFAALKPRPGAGVDANGKPIYKQYVVVTYDPRTAQSWFVPGRIRDKNDKPTYEADFNDIYKYRTYFSTDFNRTTGEPLDPSDRYNWPVWDTVDKDTLKNSRYFGLYVEDETKRNVETYPKGPAFISGEDIFATFKDTDLNYYQKGYGKAKEEGYPLYVQIENMIYSWGFGQYKDMVFLKYDFINMSPDTLLQCWHAPVMDVDVGRNPFTAFGARNDRVSWYTCDTTLNMAVQWSDPENGERGFGFGYLGFDYLESPSINKYYIIDGEGNKVQVLPSPTMPYPYYFNRDGDTLYPNEDTWDDTGYLRKTRRVYPVEEQLGLVTFQNWSIQDDKVTDEQRYEYMSDANPAKDTGPGDKRYLMATGAYNMLPRDTARVVVGVLLARTAKGGEAEGMDHCDDLTELDKLDRFAQDVYDNNFKSPLPPERPVISEWKPLNNGVMIKWDNTSELSEDDEADGLDFLGYKLYRARRPELDTFNLTQASPSGEFPNGTGPLGWKQIANYQIPTPFYKSSHVSGNGNNEYFTAIDQLALAGPVVNNGQAVPVTEPFDLYALNVMRIPQGALVYDELTSITLSNSPAIKENKLKNKLLPMIAAIDTSGSLNYSFGNTSFSMDIGKEWPKYFHNYAGGNDGFVDANTQNPILYYNYYDEKNNNKLLTDILIGKVYLNRSLIAVNPLHYKKKNIKIDQAKNNWVKYLYTTTGAAQVIGDQIIIRSKMITDTIRTRLRDSTVKINDSTSITIKVKDTIWTPDVNNPGQFIAVRDSFKVDVPKVDSVYYYNTLRNPFGTNEYTIDISVQRTEGELMSDPNAITETLDSVYIWLKNGYARVEWPEVTETYTNKKGQQVTRSIGFEQTEAVRKGVISEIMKRVTNDRTFIDVGDDNKDGFINTQPDPTATEQLINNVNYFYKLIPYDEGDYSRNFPQQPNTTPFSDNFSIITNMVKTFPEASSVGPTPKIEIISKTDDLLGGVYNINFYALNNDRVKQLFAGDTLELSWEPTWLDGQWIPIGEKDTNKAVNYSLLYRNLKLINISDNNKLLYSAQTSFEPVACEGGLLGALTENAGSYVMAVGDSILVDSASIRYVGGQAVYDTITLNRLNSMETIKRRGHFTTGNMELKDWCYQRGFDQDAYGSIGFEYDFVVKQYGGVFRPELIEKLGDAKNRNTIIKKIDQTQQFNPDRVNITQVVNYDESGVRLAGATGNPQFVAPNLQPEKSSFNNGPGDYIVEFLPGGVEKHTFQYGDDPSSANIKSITYDLTYLNVKVTNVTDFKRYDDKIKDSVSIPFKANLENVSLPTSGPRYKVGTGGTLKDYLMSPAYYPHPKNLTAAGRDPLEFYGNFNIYASGWIGLREKGGMPSFLPLIEKLYAYPTNVDYDKTDVRNAYPYSGLQGKYYLSATTTGDDGNPISIDFTHVLNIAGAQYILDFANAGRLVPNLTTDQRQYDANKPELGYPALKDAQDFKPGDQIKLSNWGSALGLPSVGAKVRAVVKTESTDYKYTEDDLKGIGVVPNPYYINHQNQRSPYDAQLYFTSLPKECTIEIYTMSGDLVKKIEHKVGENGQKRAVEIWDLISKNGFRVQSQVLMAVITTPSGEAVTKTFSVVVGSFRIVD